MASSFKNAGLDVGVLDASAGDIYTASGSGVTAVIHAVYISNLSATNVAKVNVKVTIDGGSTFRHVGRSLEVDVNVFPVSLGLGILSKVGLIFLIFFDIKNEISLNFPLLCVPINIFFIST